MRHHRVIMQYQQNDSGIPTQQVGKNASLTPATRAKLQTHISTRRTRKRIIMRSHQETIMKRLNRTADREQIMNAPSAPIMKNTARDERIMTPEHAKIMQSIREPSSVFWSDDDRGCHFHSDLVAGRAA